MKEILKTPKQWADELGVKLELKKPVKPITQKVMKTEMTPTAFCYQLFISKEIDYDYTKDKKQFEENLKSFQIKYKLSDLIVNSLLKSKKGSIG